MTYREWERYERERLASRNGVANDLRTRVTELEAALKALIEDTGVKFHGGNRAYRCDTCYGFSWLREDFVHDDDCAWWGAVQALGSE